MAAYESYKDSGVKWLGQIPSHWKRRSLRNYLRSFSERNHSDKQLLSVTRDKGVIIRGSKGEDNNHNIIPEDLNGYKYVNPGDFIINKMKSWQGSYGVSDFEGIVSPAYFTYHLDFPNKKFFSLALRSSAYIPFFMQYSKGIRVDQWDLTPEALKTIPFFVPTPEEQEAIVAYLDKVTGEIDRAIEAQRKIIEALNERKQIIITRAVTKGLNPDVPLRDSGIDWLGQIPEHWRISMLKRHASLILGKMLDTKGGSSANWSKYICAKDVHFEGIDTSDLKSMYFSEKEKIVYKVCNGDVLIVEGGAGAGGCAIVKNLSDNVYIQNSIIIIRPQENLDKEYLTYLILSLVKRGYIEYACNKATIPHFTKEKVGRVPITIPSIEEQVNIVLMTKSQILPIEKTIERCERLIKLLQERKQIIINEVVTGKRKVI